ncbi:MAG: hypothetical protein WD972_00505 [Candidatus Andersenbacteria bacterium]
MAESLKPYTDNAAEKQPTSEPLTMKNVVLALIEVMQRHRDYYSKPVETTPNQKSKLGDTTDRSTAILTEVDSAWRKLQANELTRASIPVINIFEGEQSRSVDTSQYINNRIIEDLYNTLRQVAGGGRSDYHSIRADAERLKKAGSSITEKSPFIHLMENVSLKDQEDRLTGLQFRVNDNLLARFRITNLAHDEEGVGDARVDLVVLPRD